MKPTTTPTEPALPLVNACCCGIDVHKDTVVVCVRTTGPDGRAVNDVRTFGTGKRDRCAFGTGQGTGKRDRCAFGTADNGEALKRTCPALSQGSVPSRTMVVNHAPEQHLHRSAVWRAGAERRAQVPLDHAVDRLETGKRDKTGKRDRCAFGTADNGEALKRTCPAFASRPVPLSASSVAAPVLTPTGDDPELDPPAQQMTKTTAATNIRASRGSVLDKSDARSAASPTDVRRWLTPVALRQRVVLAEILGRPVAMRDDR